MIYAKELILLKVITLKNVWFTTIVFLIMGFRFKYQDSVFNGCHDLTMLCVNISDIAVITVKGAHYC